jgi:enhancing lycopene biosynthesis protein 2
MSKHIAVILSGCGVFDGAEINEVVLTLLHLEKHGATYQCYAPDIEQHHVINHLNGEELAQTRNVMVESARIVRGNVKALTELDASEFDALIVPGGFGVAKNLSTFAINGTDMTIQPDMLSACRAFKEAGKPAGYMCIAPALCAAIFGDGVKATIGTDADTAAALNAMGAAHCDSQVGDIVVDNDHKLVTTPAYMLAENLVQAESGIAKLVSKVLELA